MGLWCFVGGKVMETEEFIVIEYVSIPTSHCLSKDKNNTSSGKMFTFRNQKPLKSQGLQASANLDQWTVNKIPKL